MLGEYEPCRECLNEFKSFILDNKLNKRDTLLLLNENSSQKRIDVVDEFSDIAERITNFDLRTERLDCYMPSLLTANAEIKED